LVDIGLPPRTGAIFLYATLAICARRIPFAATALLFLAVLAFDMVRTLSLMFGLAPSEFMAALDHARRINFFSSPLYVTLIGAVATTTITAFYFLSQRTKLMQGNIYVLFGTALAFAPLDYVTNVSAHYQFGSMFGRDKPVASAADVSGFNAGAGANGRNVVIVIVESLGYMLDSTARAHRRAALRPANCPEICRDIRQRDLLRLDDRGRNARIGDTRTFYADYARKYGYSCLPKLLHRRGYVSLAVHGFSGSMFGRQFWYPGLGFDKAIFGDKLVKESPACAAAASAACATPISRR
jgi:hypothetical protein